MSSKKKKKNGGQHAQNSSPKPANAAAAKPESKPAENQEEAASELSLSDMLAFAHEVEESQDNVPESKKEAPKAEAKPESKKEAPKAEAKPEPKKEAPKAEAKPEPKKEAPKAEAKPEPKKEAPKAEAKPEPKKEAPKPVAGLDALPNTSTATGLPMTKEENDRLSAAVDALDRDLESARRKKLQEEAYIKRRREEEARKEAERIQQAKKVEQRHQNAEENARIAAEKRAKAQAELRAKQALIGSPPPAAPVKVTATGKAFNNALSNMEAVRSFAIFIIVLVIAYAAAFVRVKSLNDALDDSMNKRLTSQNKIVGEDSLAYSLPSSSVYSADEKSKMNLSLFLLDSDKDGLSDEYEINVTNTNPHIADSDGDGVMDGAEIRAGLDPNAPKTDGENEDSKVIRDTVIADRNVAAKIKGIHKSTFVTLTEVNNNSIQGAPGLISRAYEFYSEKSFEDCELSFIYTEDDLNKSQCPPMALSIFKFNSDDLVFERLTSEVNTTSRTVSAHIDGSGIYALCDSSVIMQKNKTNIFFLIDNSGSMYPQSMCDGSEENDVEFKRLEYAVNLIDMLGDNANYGAAHFSGSYSNITPISSDHEAVKQKINDIRNANPVFSGTEIAGSVSHAVAEFASAGKNDRNYIILLTDGMTDNFNPTTHAAAIAAAQEKNITIFTIGLGKYIDADYLLNIANQTNGQFFKASNADALENIYEKIQNFMSYNQITIEDSDSSKGFIIADCGFNVQHDGLGYSNFHADFAPNGADVGIAGLVRDYYTGNLEMKTNGYQLPDGAVVDGYDITGVSAFQDGRVDLKEIEVASLSKYSYFLTMDDKYNFRKVTDNTLRFTDKARDFLDASGLDVYHSEFEFIHPDESSLDSFLRFITFSPIREFNKYECALICRSKMTGDDKAVMDMINWYSKLPESSSCEIYDFAYEGDLAFGTLIGKLTVGEPAMVVFGGSAMNAVRLIRDTDNPNKFLLDAFDCNSPERSTRINIYRNPIYDNGGAVTYQYSASRGSEDEPFQIVVSK